MPINGDGYANTLYGTTGNDVINAYGGTDTIYLSRGNDQIDGGTGFDRLVVTLSDTSLFGSLPTGPRTYVITSTGISASSGSINTSFTGIERLTFNALDTGDFGDTVDASGFVSTIDIPLPLAIYLGDGDDTVIGHAGEDYIWLGLGDNRLDAGGGYDTVRVDVENSGGQVIYLGASGGALHTTRNGVTTNSISNAESVTIRPSDVDAPLTRMDASGLVGFTGTITFGDSNGTNILIGSRRGDVFENVDGYTAGDDVYTGNGGADVYDYTFAIDAMDRDTITDFDWDDGINFQYNNDPSWGPLANKYIGTAEFTGTAGEFRFETVGNRTLVEVDTDGDAVADETLTIANGAFTLQFNSSGYWEIAGNRVTGTAASDELSGTSGADLMAGLAGADTMSGLKGNDIYYVDHGKDQVIELAGQGSDRVYSTVSFTLSANVEKLWLTGSGRINGTGNSGANTITGNDAANVLSGGGGADTMFGGLGNDTYVVDNAGDRASGETSTGGVDLVKSSITFSLAANLEKLTLTGSSAINGTGNGLANTMVGNLGDNVLRGGGGNDSVRGGGGADEIYGGLGKDSLAGGAGADGFYFDTALNALSNADRILGFSVADDSIHLDLSVFTAAGRAGTLAAGAFRFGTAAADSSDRIIYDSATGKIYYDADGSGAGAKVLFAQVTAGTALTNADFIVEAAGARVESAAKTGGGELETVGPGYLLGVIPHLAAQQHWSHAGSMDARFDWAVDYFSA